MKNPTRTPDRAAVARCLREMEKLFGKRPPENDKSHGEVAFIGTAEIKLPANHTKNSGGTL